MKLCYHVSRSRLESPAHICDSMIPFGRLSVSSSNDLLQIVELTSIKYPFRSSLEVFPP